MTNNLYYSGHLKPYAQRLRREMTDAERKLWYFLRNDQLGVRFNRQVPIGDYIVDFLCRKKKLVIELDGSQHDDDVQREKDGVRDSTLKKLGYVILRFNDYDALVNTEGVVEKIADRVRSIVPKNPSRSP